MNKQQKKKILDTISKDATGRYYYVSDNGDMCVIAGLCGAFGKSPESELSDDDIDFAGLNQDFIDWLENKTGLSESDLSMLQLINDEYKTVKTRRAALKRYVNELAVQK